MNSAAGTERTTFDCQNRAFPPPASGKVLAPATDGAVGNAEQPGDPVVACNHAAALSTVAAAEDGWARPNTIRTRVFEHLPEQWKSVRVPRDCASILPRQQFWPITYGDDDNQEPLTRYNEWSARALARPAIRAAAVSATHLCSGLAGENSARADCPLLGRLRLLVEPSRLRASASSSAPHLVRLKSPPPGSCPDRRLLTDRRTH